MKEMNHRFPRDAREYRTLQQYIVRERSTETNVHVLRTPASGHNAHAGLYFSEPAAEPMPLYLALVRGGGSQSVSGNGGIPAETQKSQNPCSSGSHAYLTLYDIGDCVDEDDNDLNWETDSDWWDTEAREDPYPQERLAEEQARAQADPQYLSELFWAARTAERRYRAASGQFKPKKHFRRRNAGKRFTKRGPSRPGQTSPSKGFFIEDYTSSRWTMCPTTS